MTDDRDRIALSLADSKQPRNLICRIHSKEPLRVFINGKLVESKQIAKEIRYQAWRMNVLIPECKEYYIPYLTTVIHEQTVVVYVDGSTGDLTCECVNGINDDRMFKNLQGMASAYFLVPCASCALPCARHSKCSACWYGNKTRVPYCSHKCHVAHWAKHKRVCQKNKSS
jgi:hypothetical protein